jgi:hypothetical protein
MRTVRVPRSIIRSGKRRSSIADMSREFDTQPPEACLRIREAQASRGAPEPGIAPPLGELSRVLAASRPGGVFLCLGHGAGETGAWILDGMDLASRLVTVIEDAAEADRLRAVFGDDLRVTVHVQDAVAFLDDVRDHRFDLITDLGGTRSPRLVGLALGRLAVGGSFMARHSIPALVEMLSAPAVDGDRAPLDPACFALAHLPGEPGFTLVARRPLRRAAKRRGGRRAREGVTPLFSSRPRASDD